MDQAIKNIHKRFSKLYILALSAVALLSIAGQVLVQVELKKQSTDGRVINLAGRQRMLSQRICKNAVLITYQIKPTRVDIYQKELNQSLETWKSVHNGLQINYLDSLGSTSPNSEEIKQLFKTIEPHYQSIYTNATLIRNNIKENSSTAIYSKMDSILAHEKDFLEGMNNIVFQYDQEARAHVAKLRNMELILLFITLTILILEGLFIFKPAVKKLNQTMEKLIVSENNAKEINQELSLVNTNLKITELELIKTTNEKHEQQLSEQKIRAASLLKGQESERKRIAREMHDGIGQMLTALKLNIESISVAQLDEKNLMLVDDVKQLIGKTIAETRTITFDLMPTVLNDFGITSALKQLADQATKTSGVNVIFEGSNSFDRLDKNTEIGLYRIAQEAINNAVKYAQATQIEIALFLKKDNLYLTISDNGNGFDLKQSYLNSDQKKINRGIYNMQERTNLLDGAFKLTTSEGQGTKILSIIPVKYQ